MCTTQFCCGARPFRRAVLTTSVLSARRPIDRTASTLVLACPRRSSLAPLSGVAEEVSMVDVDGLRPRAFGRWLLAQVPREGWVGELIAAAKRDPHFPK